MARGRSAMPALTTLRGLWAVSPPSWLLAQQWKVRRLSPEVDKSGNSTIAPNFQAGLNLNQLTVPLRPPTTIKARRSRRKGSSGSAVTNSDLNSVLRDVNKTPYPSSGTDSAFICPIPWIPG